MLVPRLSLVMRTWSLLSLYTSKCNRAPHITHPHTHTHKHTHTHTHTQTHTHAYTHMHTHTHTHTHTACSDTLFSGSNDMTVKVWSLESFKIDKSFQAHEDPVCTLTGNDTYLFSGSLKSIKVLHVHVFFEIQYFSRYMYLPIHVHVFPEIQYFRSHLHHPCTCIYSPLAFGHAYIHISYIL